jgi:transcriptional regulator with XRE-family HTH domain
MAQEGARPSQVFARRMREVREHRGWTQQDLADRLKELGVGIDRATLARIENGTRGLPLDDALVISAALGPSPLHMFVPTNSSEAVALAPKLIESARLVREWIRGRRRLRDKDREVFWSEVADFDWALREQKYFELMLFKVQEFFEAGENRERAAQVLEDIKNVVAMMKRGLEREET